MPFPHLEYFITGIFLSAKNEVLLPPYQLSRASRRMVITRLVVFLVSLFLALYPTLMTLFCWIDGIPYDIYYIFAVILWSFALTVYFFGFFRGAVLTTLCTGVGYLLLLGVRLLYRALIDREALFFFFILDIAVIATILIFYAVRKYHRMHFVLLSDFERGDEKWGLNLLPPNLAERRHFRKRYTFFYRIAVSLTEQDDPFYLRMSVASDLYDFTKRKQAYFLGCSLSPAENSFFFYLYGDGKPGFLRSLRRFMRLRSKSFTVTAEEDALLSHCTAMLPSVNEMFYAYTHLLFSVASPENIARGRAIPVSFFFAMKDAKTAGEFVSLCDKEGFHLSDVSREDMAQGQENDVFSVKQPAENEKNTEETVSIAVQESEYSCYITLIKDLIVSEALMNQTTDLLLSLLSDLGQMITWDISFLEVEAALPKENTAEIG